MTDVFVVASQVSPLLESATKAVGGANEGKATSPRTGRSGRRSSILDMINEGGSHCCDFSAMFQWLSNFIKTSLFENFILSMIVLSSIALAVESPKLDPDSTVAYLLVVFDTFFTFLFTVEMIMKIFVMGLAGHKGSYLSSSWNCLDGFIVLVSLVSHFTPNLDIGFLRTLRFLRVLRPLRFVFIVVQ